MLGVYSHQSIKRLWAAQRLSMTYHFVCVHASQAQRPCQIQLLDTNSHQSAAFEQLICKFLSMTNSLDYTGQGFHGNDCRFFRYFPKGEQAWIECGAITQFDANGGLLWLSSFKLPGPLQFVEWGSSHVQRHSCSQIAGIHPQLHCLCRNVLILSVCMFKHYCSVM